VVVEHVSILDQSPTDIRLISTSNAYSIWPNYIGIVRYGLKSIITP
jgi:hypothetical protein